LEAFVVENPDLLLRTLDHQLEVDLHVVTQGTQGQEVHEDVALAVGRSAPVPASVLLGELEGRRLPGGVVEGRLHVVVGVQEHGGRVSARARSGADHCVAAVRRPGEPGVGEAEGRELLEDPLRRAVALLRRELARVGDRPDGDQLGQLLPRPGHQVGDTGAQAHAHVHGHEPATSSVLRSSTYSLKSSSSSGQ
jgi:hypothetical protein